MGTRRKGGSEDVEIFMELTEKLQKLFWSLEHMCQTIEAFLFIRHVLGSWIDSEKVGVVRLDKAALCNELEIEDVDE